MVPELTKLRHGTRCRWLASCAATGTALGVHIRRQYYQLKWHQIGVWSGNKYVIETINKYKTSLTVSLLYCQYCADWCPGTSVCTSTEKRELLWCPTNVVVTGGTVGRRYEKPRSRRWLQSWHHDAPRCSVSALAQWRPRSGPTRSVRLSVTVKSGAADTQDYVRRVVPESRAGTSNYI